MFRLLVDQIGAARLGEVRRFTQFWERSASLRLRAGDASVLDLYQSHGRIVGGTRTDMVEVAFDAWRKSRAEGHSVGVLAPDHAGVDALALRARAHRVAAGEVEAVGVTAGNQTIGVGDEVVTCRNDRRLRTEKGTWVRNGQRWVVTARYPDSSSRPMLEDWLRSFSDRVGELEQELAEIAARRDELAPVLRATDERLRWRRPRREVVDAARAESAKLGQRRVDVVESRNQIDQRVARLGQNLAAADEAAYRLPALEAEQADRDGWLRGQPPEVVWVKELRRRIDALHYPPEHLVRLLGPPGASLSVDDWGDVAERVEAYRERWRLKPNELSRPPSRNSAQAKHWSEVDLLLPELQRSQTRPVSREVDHGLSM